MRPWIGPQTGAMAAYYYIAGLDDHRRRYFRIRCEGFFAPEDLCVRLQATYLRYRRHLPTRHRPRGPPSFRGFFEFMVHMDHVDWWAGLLEAVAPFTYSGLPFTNQDPEAVLMAEPVAMIELSVIAATTWALTIDEPLAPWLDRLGVDQRAGGLVVRGDTPPARRGQR